eukprot:jgi/Mesen1/10474/ME000083S09975
MEKLALLKDAMGGAKEMMGGAKDMMGGAVSVAMDRVVDKAKGAAGKAREMVGLAREEAEAAPPPQEPSMLDELNQSCALSYKQRVYGFSACLSLGLFCSLLSMLVFFHPVKFAITYTFGNLLALGSTGFLIGFGRQLKMMFDPVRAIAAIIYLVAILLTLFCALYLGDPLLTLVCITGQGAALLWYSLSYIPFAQAAARSIFRSCYESGV